MLKLVGCLFIILSGAMTGNSVAVSFKNKLELQRTLQRLYSQSAILLEYSLLTFSELICQLHSSESFSKLSFLYVPDDCTDVRQAVLDGIRNWDPPDEASGQILVSFFTDLGTTDISGQLSFVRLALARQTEIVEAEKKRINERLRLSRTFGVLGGAFAAIMIM